MYGSGKQTAAAIKVKDFDAKHKANELGHYEEAFGNPNITKHQLNQAVMNWEIINCSA